MSYIEVRDLSSHYWRALEDYVSSFEGADPGVWRL